MPFVLYRSLALVAVAAVAGGCLPRNDYTPPPQTGGFLEGQRHFLDGDYESAAESFQEFVARHPRSRAVAEVHYWIGVCRLKQKRYRSAELAFQRCLASRPAGALKLKAWAGIGDCHRLENRLGPAAEVYDRVLRARSPEIEHDLIMFNRGVCLLRKGDLAAGKKVLSRCVREHPASPWAAAAKERLGLAGSFRVQTGSFASRKSAEAQSRELREKGFNPRVEVSGGKFNVRMGGLPAWRHALALAERLRSAGFDAVCLP